MVNYIILPLFAFANAGVSLTADHGGLEVGMATWAVLAGVLAYLVLQFALPKQPAQE